MQNLPLRNGILPYPVRGSHMEFTLLKYELISIISHHLKNITDTQTQYNQFAAIDWSTLGMDIEAQVIPHSITKFLAKNLAYKDLMIGTTNHQVN